MKNSFILRGIREHLLELFAKKLMNSVESEAVARFVLDSFHRAHGEKNSKAALRAMFNVLKNGWKKVIIGDSNYF